MEGVGYVPSPKGEGTRGVLLPHEEACRGVSLTLWGSGFGV